MKGRVSDSDSLKSSAHISGRVLNQREQRHHPRTPCPCAPSRRIHSCLSSRPTDVSIAPHGWPSAATRHRPSTHPH